jgi:hypothetical protein
MGLNITAYRRAIPVADHVAKVKDNGLPETWCTLEAEWGDRGHVQAFVYAEFQSSIDGLIPGQCYVVDDTDSIRFAAGSYTGYNEWRDDLARCVLGISAKDVFELAPQLGERMAFLELINFADNVGTIGPKAAKRLSADFIEHRARFVAAHVDDVGDRWAIKKYDSWASAFALAAQGGLVDFG